MHNDTLIKKKTPIVFNIWLAKETIKAYPSANTGLLRKPNGNKQNNTFIFIHIDNISTGQLWKQTVDSLRQHFFI